MAIARELVTQRNIAVAIRIEEIEVHLRLLMQALQLGPHNEAAMFNAQELQYHVDVLKQLLNQ